MPRLAVRVPDRVLKNFLLHVTTADDSAFASTTLPGNLDGVGFAPPSGTTTWSGRWDLTADNGGNYQAGLSFGSGTERVGSPSGVQMSYRLVDDTAGNPGGGSSPVPAPATAGLFLAGLATARRRRRGVQ